jgi:hypothetical protein
LVGFGLDLGFDEYTLLLVCTQIGLSLVVLQGGVESARVDYGLTFHLCIHLLHFYYFTKLVRLIYEAVGLLLRYQVANPLMPQRVRRQNFDHYQPNDRNT